MRYRLLKATFEPNYPVCKGVMILAADFKDSFMVVKDNLPHIAQSLGFSNTKLKDVTILGTSDLAPCAAEYIINGFYILHYENGEH